jgi:hypothetical protein
LVDEICPICRGFGKVHPVFDGRIDYGSLVFCSCRGDRAFETAHPPLKHPDTDWDIPGRRIPDEFDRARQLRCRRSEAFKAELKEAAKDDPAFHCPEDIVKNHPPRDGWRELIAIKEELEALKQQISAKQRKAPPALRNGGF